MLDLPDQPIIDKEKLVGGCVRLPLRVDVLRLQKEIAALPVTAWGTTAGRVGVHRATEAIFLRGYAPAEGEKPIEDRATLAALPYIREIVGELIPSSPQRCLLARMPGATSIAPHIDRAPYFAKTLRVHIPVVTSDKVWMMAAELCYSMRAGEVWVLNNNTAHAVWNAHPELSRTHLICDFLATPALLNLLARGEPELGEDVPEVRRFFGLG